ncbi:hypothetical protein CcCBS67573_g01219 [Chytriomyces confervae]|uniref:LIM zinc-binding domain-containing protein n=1 Tax=Chytriomyces confervae TaxID=246404 RepID=A0A507FR84_9FUNG|nr:hypothetical protein HDU80_005290 [Chytriomyces hyalinus]TPX77497.1 hypothetical protein CcCBS67573_g01219 [Chytriomyces confervae]
MDDLDSLLSDLENASVFVEEADPTAHPASHLPNLPPPAAKTTIKPLFQSRKKTITSGRSRTVSSSCEKLSSANESLPSSVATLTASNQSLFTPPTPQTQNTRTSSSKPISAFCRSSPTVSTQPESAALEVVPPNLECHGCRSLITSAPFITTNNGHSFHPNHFLCKNESCKRALKGTVYIQEPSTGDAYCKTCFTQLYSEPCNYCKGPILEACVKACNKSFHPACFFCSNCGCQLGTSRQPFVETQGKVYCVPDYDLLFGKTCKGCGLKCGATEEAVSLVDRDLVFHLDCFKCHIGGCALRAHEFYEDEVTGLPVCQLHYYGARDAVCFACEKIVVGACVNALGRRYHRACFVCTFCRKALDGGGAAGGSVDRFKSKNNNPYCSGCHLKLFG